MGNQTVGIWHFFLIYHLTIYPHQKLQLLFYSQTDNSVKLVIKEWENVYIIIYM